jgi:hypothetical protein
VDSTTWYNHMHVVILGIGGASGRVTSFIFASML